MLRCSKVVTQGGTSNAFVFSPLGFFYSQGMLHASQLVSCGQPMVEAWVYDHQEASKWMHTWHISTTLNQGNVYILRPFCTVALPLTKFEHNGWLWSWHMWHISTTLNLGNTVYSISLLNSYFAINRIRTKWLTVKLGHIAPHTAELFLSFTSFYTQASLSHFCFNYLNFLTKKSIWHRKLASVEVALMMSTRAEPSTS